MTAADNLLTFKAAVKSIAARNGLYASFMPKPLPDKSGSGLHVNLSLSQGGRNIFKTALMRATWPGGGVRFYGRSTGPHPGDYRVS